MFYNLKTNSFTNTLPNINETDFLRIMSCGHINKQTITFICLSDEPLCLHNEDVETEKKAIELFIKQDENFKQFLDFFN